MAKLIFEELMPAFQIVGDLKCFLKERPMEGQSVIIQKDNEFDVIFEWKQKGWLGMFLDGNWKCQVFFEAMGEKEESYAPVGMTAFVQKEEVDYKLVVTVPARTLDAGIYRVVGRILFNNKLNEPAPIAAFADLGLIQIYESVK